ncbi:uncharacterized protein LOC128731987 [Anopheles nili]|uniref:uncharacterized protein LOC128731987 n=1 Tax=Anopheles nili TaxID=185578 RepID=UPI00237AA8AB|nr:uncharacterized protein LOC128731987 [Anopheles nili]
MKFSATVRLSVLVWLACVAIGSVSCGRKKTEVVSDDGSSTFSEGKHESREKFAKRVRDSDNHIAHRMTRYFKFGGILQAISEKTGIPRTELVTGGASKVQDQSSGLGQAIHAAHIIRVGAIDSRLNAKDAALYRALSTFLGHTQNVDRKVNVWHGVGGEIDRLQSDNLGKLASVDFREVLEPDDHRSVEELMDLFVNVIDAYARSGKRNEQEQTQLDEDKYTVHLADPLLLFENGKQGYEMVKNGDFVQRFDKLSRRAA